MTTDEAGRLVAKLFAAFAFPQDKLTAAVYVEQLARLERQDFALEAVNDLIRVEERLPPVARVRAAYRAVVARNPQPSLPMPDLTEAERAESLARARELLGRIGGGSA